jgi:hypothetical protein
MCNVLGKRAGGHWNRLFASTGAGKANVSLRTRAFLATLKHVWRKLSWHGRRNSKSVTAGAIRMGKGILKVKKDERKFEKTPVLAAFGVGSWIPMENNI